MRRCTMLALVLLATALGSLSAADWPQWRGPNRDGHSGEVGVKKALCTEGGPKLAWTFKDTGLGLSTPAVLGDRAYVQGNRKGTEYVIALDLKNGGKELWATPMGPVYDFEGNVWTAGPNSTPAVEKDRLYAVSSNGKLICVDTTNDGKSVWNIDMPKALGATVTEVGGGKGGWGFSWSPLIDGDKLIITPGGQKGLVAALDKKSGEVLWQSKLVVTECTYSSVVAATIHDVPQYIVMTQDGVVSIDAKTGKEVWAYKRDNPFPDMICTTPIVQGDKVLITGTKAGTEVLEITKMGAGFVAGKVYSSKQMGNFNGGVIYLNGFVYGANEARDWKCLDFTNGKANWSTTDVGYGPICYVDGVFIFQSQENNDVAIVEADPKAFKQLGGWKLPQVSKLRKSNTKFWTPPIVAAGKLFLRDQELLFCYELK
jgi:outer membrane protein assembly factor BamB